MQHNSEHVGLSGGLEFFCSTIFLQAQCSYMQVCVDSIKNSRDTWRLRSIWVCKVRYLSVFVFIMAHFFSDSKKNMIKEMYYRKSDANM